MRAPRWSSQTAIGTRPNGLRVLTYPGGQVVLKRGTIGLVLARQEAITLQAVLGKVVR